MKVLLYNHDSMHHKNKHALLLYNIEYYVCNNLENFNLSEFDVVYSPCLPIDVSKYPNTKFIFGPHFSIFPKIDSMNLIKGKNTIYIQPSEWVVNLWENHDICNNIKLRDLPFGVDTNIFEEINNISNRNKIFIYFKRRSYNELNIIKTYLNSLNINYKLFQYGNYNEKTYLEYLQNSKYGIWLDAHESQGFALEEALSCNIPLLVWNVTSMNQEEGSSYSNIPATTIPYFDERCGEYFYESKDFENIFNLFLSKLETYKPREFILENLSINICEKKLINLINNM